MTDQPQFTISSRFTNASGLVVGDLPAPPAGKRGWPWTVGARALPKCQRDGSPWPKLSIVTPSYNQGEFLEATIRSVLLQGYPNLEYVVIDGGSGDDSLEIIEKYSDYLSHWVSEKDSGQTNAINKGIKQTSGDILAWINSDDIYTKGAFTRVTTAFFDDPKSIVVYSNRALIDENQQVFGCSPLEEFNPPITPYLVCSETAFWRREAMENIGLLDESLNFCMDVDFFCRLLTQGKFKKIDDYLGYFRCHRLSKTSTVGDTVGRQEAEAISLKMFGAIMPDRQRPRRLKALFHFIKHPSLIGIPYIRTRLSKFSLRL